MKKIISTLLISLIMLCNCVISNAAEYASLAFTANSTSVDVGSEISIYLEVKSLSGIDTLYGVSANLDYDKEAFELVNITGENSWSITKGNIISAIHSDGVTSGKILKVVLKALKAPENGSTAVTFKNVSVTDNNDEFSQSDVSYTINIKEAAVTPEPDTNTNEPTTNTNQPTTNTGSNNTTNGGSSVNTNKDNTATTTKLPATGLDITIALFILLAIVVGVASFIRYKQVKLK